MRRSTTAAVGERGYISAAATLRRRD